MKILASIAAGVLLATIAGPAWATDPGPKPDPIVTYDVNEIIWCNVVDTSRDRYTTDWVLSDDGTQWVKGETEVYLGEWEKQRKSTRADWIRGGILDICDPSSKPQPKPKRHPASAPTVTPAKANAVQPIKAEVHLPNLRAFHGRWVSPHAV